MGGHFGSTGAAQEAGMLTALKSLSIVAVFATAMFVGKGSTPVTLGTVTMKDGGGTSTSTVDVNAITPTGGPEITATIKNGLDQRKITDITVSVVRDGTTGTGPQPGTTPPNWSLQKGTATPVTVQSEALSTGMKAHFDLSADPLMPTEEMTLNIEIPSHGTATDYKVKITPSAKANSSSADADCVENFKLKLSARQSTHSLLDGSNRRVLFSVTNTDSTYSMISFFGEITFPSTNEITGVFLYDPAEEEEVGSVSYTILSETEFKIEDFTPLAPDETYEITVIFEEVPTYVDNDMLDVDLTAFFNN